MMLPIFTVTCCTWTSFAVNDDSREAQFTISITLLLTLVASKLLVSEGLPKSPHLTVLDRYVVLSLYTVVGCVLCHLTPPDLLAFGTDEDDAGRDSSLLLGLGLFAFYLLCQVMLMVYVSFGRSSPVQVLKSEDHEARPPSCLMRM